MERKTPTLWFDRGGGGGAEAELELAKEGQMGVS